MPYRSAEAEDLDIFELLARWEPTDSVAGPSSRPRLGSVTSEVPPVAAPEPLFFPGRSVALLTPVRGTPLDPDRSPPMPPFQQQRGRSQEGARYPGLAHGPYLRRRFARGSPISQATCSAFSLGAQQPICALPQQGVSSTYDAEGVSLFQETHKPPQNLTACGCQTGQGNIRCIFRQHYSAWPKLLRRLLHTTHASLRRLREGPVSFTVLLSLQQA